LKGKLFSYFKKNFSVTSVISYADRRWSLGNLYRQLGLTETHISVPNYWYVKSNKRFHRFTYRKNVLEKKLKVFDKEKKTEYQNMLINKFDKIWDCGNYVFSYQNDLK